MAYVVIATKEENLGFTTNQRERFLSRSFGFLMAMIIERNRRTPARVPYIIAKCTI